MDESLKFNPFEDRFSRDLRNDLSEAFVRDLESGTEQLLEQTIAHYQEQPLHDCYHNYLEKRIKLYKIARTQLVNEKDSLAQAIVLWNLGLFFEVHEILEHSWYDAEGPTRKILQAMIRAAGVYIKRRYGYKESAARIAAKAIPVLKENRQQLKAYFQVEQLTTVLLDETSPPPKLTL